MIKCVSDVYYVYQRCIVNGFPWLVQGKPSMEVFLHHFSRSQKACGLGESRHDVHVLDGLA